MMTLLCFGNVERLGRAMHVLTLAATLCAPAPALAQQYPTKPVRVIVPLAPGGGSDITARQFSAKLSESLGQAFVVENRSGAGGLIGMEIVAKAPADGYTLLIMGGGFTTVAAIQRPAWDPINALPPIAEFGITPFVLSVHPSLPARSTQELIAVARAKPGEIAYASAGVAGITHLASALFENMARVKMIHVPYKSTGAAMADLLSGQVPFIVGSLLPMRPHIASGRLRPLAVTTAKRWYSLPDLPTVAETLPGYEIEVSFGAYAPRGTPRPVVERLNAAINNALELPDIRRYLDKEGMQGMGGTPERFSERIRRDYERWIKLARDVNIKAD